MKTSTTTHKPDCSKITGEGSASCNCRELQHTPTPWKAKDGEHGSITISNKGLPIADVSYWDEPGQPQDGWMTQEEAKVVAAFIVKAVNCHEELLDAMKEALKAGENQGQAWKWAPILREAIAKAESL